MDFVHAIYQLQRFEQPTNSASPCNTIFTLSGMEKEGRVAAVVHDEGLEAGPHDLRRADLRRGEARSEIRRKSLGRVRQVF